MYVPGHFRETRREVLLEAMRGIQFATLVTPGSAGLEITHLPTLVTESADTIVVEGHVARANPHWRVAPAPGPSVAIYRGPDAYVSPSWYPSKTRDGKVVPTWNYIAVHAHGRLEAIDDPEWLKGHVTRLSARNEAGREKPWSVSDAPEDYIGRMVRGIVGLRLTVERLEGAWKMAQQKPEADRRGAAAGLAASPDEGDRAVAGVMAALEAARGEDT